MALTTQIRRGADFASRNPGKMVLGVLIAVPILALVVRSF